MAYQPIEDYGVIGNLRTAAAGHSPAQSVVADGHLLVASRNDNTVVVLDPKSELSRLCLQLTPPDCAKRVWFLDLGRPAFGMSPLRLTGTDPLPLQATAIADNIVAALLDINENQIFQSSRRYLYHAVIGAIALAAKQGRRARFEDVYQLLLPLKTDVRTALALAAVSQRRVVDEDARHGAPAMKRP